MSLQVTGNRINERAYNDLCEAGDIQLESLLFDGGFEVNLYLSLISLLCYADNIRT